MSASEASVPARKLGAGGAGGGRGPRRPRATGPRRSSCTTGSARRRGRAGPTRSRTRRPASPSRRDFDQGLAAANVMPAPQDVTLRLARPADPGREAGRAGGSPPSRPTRRRSSWSTASSPAAGRRACCSRPGCSTGRLLRVPDGPPRPRGLRGRRRAVRRRQRGVHGRPGRLGLGPGAGRAGRADRPARVLVRVDQRHRRGGPGAAGGRRSGRTPSPTRMDEGDRQLPRRPDATTRPGCPGSSSRARWSGRGSSRATTSRSSTRSTRWPRTRGRAHRVRARRQDEVLPASMATELHDRGRGRGRRRRRTPGSSRTPATRRASTWIPPATSSGWSRSSRGLSARRRDRREPRLGAMSDQDPARTVRPTPAQPRYGTRSAGTSASPSATAWSCRANLWLPAPRPGEPGGARSRSSSR